jgi:hypothetical protein
MLPDLLSTTNFSWDERRVRVSDGLPMRSYQLRAAHKIFMGEPVRNPMTGIKDAATPYRDGTAIHLDPGMGKTIIALTAISEWVKQGITLKPTLVVAPIKVCETVWRQEAAAWTHTRHLTFQLIRGTEKIRAFAQKRPAHIHLINPEMLEWLQKYIRSDWTAEYDALIMDDTIFRDNRTRRFRVLSNYGTRVTVKGPDGKPWTCPLTGLTKVVPPPRFKRAAHLTGTPSPSGLHNLWSPFYLLDHGARLQKQYDTFQGRFFHRTKQVAAHVFKYALNDEEDEVRPEWQVRDGGQERIHELIADITVELNAEDYGVLPKQMPPVKHYIDLPDEILPFYRQLEKEAVFEMLKDPIIAANGGAKSMMCWQICNGALYSTDENGAKVWKEVHTRKLDKLVELIDEADQNRLIPYWFNHDRERIVARFKAEGIPYTILTSKHVEHTIDAWNEGRIPNLLIHPQSAAHGLNMQFGGHRLTWFGPIWSLERWIQTIARLARSGQNSIVGIDVIMARNTTDEVRFNSLGEHGSEMERMRKATHDYQKTMGIDIGSMPEIGNTRFGGLML